MLEPENKLVACRSANEPVQRIDTFVVDNASLIIGINCSCDELDFYVQTDQQK
jgi:hypothetical protein